VWKKNRTAKQLFRAAAALKVHSAIVELHFEKQDGVLLFSFKLLLLFSVHLCRPVQRRFVFFARVRLIRKVVCVGGECSLAENALQV
jgi:hypothetical protein